MNNADVQWYQRRVKKSKLVLWRSKRSKPIYGKAEKHAQQKTKPVLTSKAVVETVKERHVSSWTIERIAQAETKIKLQTPKHKKDHPQTSGHQKRSSPHSLLIRKAIGCTLRSYRKNISFFRASCTSRIHAPLSSGVVRSKVRCLSSSGENTC